VIRLLAESFGVRIQVRPRDFPLHQNVPTVLGPFSLLLCVRRVSFTEVKRPGPEFVQSPPRRTKLMNEWSCTSTVHIHLHVVDRDKLPCSVVRNEIFWICDILFDRAELRSARFLKHHTVLLAQSVQSKGAFHLPCQWTQTDHTCSWQGAKWRYFPTNFHSKILSSVKNTLN